MLTINADHHPLMRRMHKPDPQLPPDAQDKRSVIAIEADDVERWLRPGGTGQGPAAAAGRVPAASRTGRADGRLTARMNPKGVNPFGFVGFIPVACHR